MMVHIALIFSIIALKQERMKNVCKPLVITVSTYNKGEIKVENINVGSVKKKILQVEEQINFLTKEISILHDRIGNLTDRIGAVLSQPSEVANTTNQLMAEIVPLAARIRESASSVSTVRGRIEDILIRLEL